MKKHANYGVAYGVCIFPPLRHLFSLIINLTTMLLEALHGNNTGLASHNVVFIPNKKINIFQKKKKKTSLS